MVTEEREWGELGGVVCPGCGDEVFRILEGVCIACGKSRQARQEQEEERQKELAEDARKHGMWTFGKKSKRPR